MNWHTVPLPERMQKLPRDARGFPIPFVVLRDANGVPAFTVNDQGRVMLALSRQLCGICGQRMPRNNIWFLGGPQSAFHPNGAYNDGPLHRECARYALQVCPYLAISSMKHRDGKALEDLGMKLGTILVDPTMDTARPPLFALVRTAAYELTGSGYIRPERPYFEAEFWRDQQQLPGEVALPILSGLNLTIQLRTAVKQSR